MALKQRISTLRRQVGQAPANVDAGAVRDAGMAARVQRLRPPGMASGTHVAVRAHSTEGRADPARRDAHLAECLEGDVLAPGVILIERRIGLDERHGSRSLAALRRDSNDLPESATCDADRLIFLDTETTGLSGGSGTAVFMLGLARVEADALILRQYVLSAFGGEAAMLTAAGEWLAGAGPLVSFNGKSFDVPLLATRCRLAGIDDPFSGREHLDLLHPTRRAFARLWDDCRLATAERRLLDFRRSDDLPGSEAPAAWLAYIQRGDARLLPAVARHNHWDLVSLAALLPALGEVHVDPAAWRADIAGVARAHLKHGDETRARTLLAAHSERLDDAALRELARLQRRAGDWAEACAIWERLAARGCRESTVHLAKYHEHVRRDPRTALAYCRNLSGDTALKSRRQRLEAKVCGGGRQVDCME